MQSRHRSIRAALGIAAALVLGLGTACSGPKPPEPVSDDAWGGTPPGYEQPSFDNILNHVDALWLEEGERFAVVSWGSSSCPPISVSLDAEDEGTLALQLDDVFNHPTPRDYGCTDDLAPTTHEFTLPEDITARPVTLIVTYHVYNAEPVLSTFTLE